MGLKAKLSLVYILAIFFVSPSKEIKASADLGDVYGCYRSKITFKGK